MNEKITLTFDQIEPAVERIRQHLGAYAERDFDLRLLDRLSDEYSRLSAEENLRTWDKLERELDRRRSSN